MSKIVLDNVASGYDLSKINVNFQKIADELNNNVLYRNAPTGEPNTLEKNLDANGKAVYNVSSISAQTLSLGGKLVSVEGVVASELPNSVGQDNKVLISDGINPVWIDPEDLHQVSKKLADTLNSSSGATNVSTIATGSSVVRTVSSKLKESVSVKDFGALGDGVTDDTAAIQATINEALSESGRKVFFPAGTYRVTSSINLNSDDTHLIGEGAYATNIYRDFTTGPTISIGKSSGTVIRASGVSSMSFGLNTGSTQAASDVAHIRTTAGENITIADIVIYDAVEGIELIGGNNIFIDRVVISGTYTTASSCRYGLTAKKNANSSSGTAQLPTHVWMNKCWFSGPDVTGALKGGMAYPLWIRAGETWHVEQCYFGQANLFNILIEQGSDNAAIIDITFNSCYVDGADRDQAGDGILITGSGIVSSEAYDGIARSGGDGSDAIQNITISTSTIKGQEADGRDGIRIAGTARAGTFAQACVGLKIIGCTIAGWYRHGINVEGCVGGLVSCNEIKGNNYTNAGNGNGIVVGAATTRLGVSGNNIGGNAFNGSTQSYQVYGISVLSGASKYMVCNNHCATNVTGNQQLSTDGIWFNNWTESGMYSVTEENGLFWLGRKVGSAAPVVLLRPSTTPANYFEMIGADAGGFVRLAASGSDTDIDMRLEPKGSGNVRFGGYTAGTFAQTGYITIKDSGGTLRRIMVG
jgi:polygalacturonase